MVFNSMPEKIDKLFRKYEQLAHLKVKERLEGKKVEEYIPTSSFPPPPPPPPPKIEYVYIQQQEETPRKSRSYGYIERKKGIIERIGEWSIRHHIPTIVLSILALEKIFGDIRAMEKEQMERQFYGKF